MKTNLDTYEIHPLEAGKRVDIVVMGLRSDITRSTIKKLIIDGNITVDNEKVMPNYKLKEGETIHFKSKQIDEYISKGYGLDILKPKKMDLEVLFEDQYLLAVNKPSGINSHPVVKKDNQSILNGVVHYLKHETRFERNVRPRLAHRLDRETSGVLLITKSLEAHDFYSKQFEDRIVKKTYKAIVHGDFKAFLERKENEYLKIDSFISTDSDNQKRYYNTSRQKGRSARTFVYFDEHFHKFGKYKFSRVTVKPETGRTHQIRVHLSSKRFPILGDTLYRGQKYKRLMLHAHEITVELYNPSEEAFEMTIQAPLPEKFLG